MSNDNFYIAQKEPVQGCFIALRQIILNQDEAISETIKYGMPCFCYRDKMFCYLWQDKEGPYILFVEGTLLHHEDLHAGTRKRMKVYRVDPELDLPIERINLLLNDAIELYRNGTVKID